MQEWNVELDALLDDLQTQDGRAILNVSDPQSYNYNSFCKLYAVYGENYTHSNEWTGEMSNGRKVYKAPPLSELKEKLRRCTSITRCCGTEKVVKAQTASEFSSKLERFMDSSNEVTSGSFWPLVKLVRASSCKWSLLRSGAVLVDAPGE